jgi:hypothetical protein
VLSETGAAQVRVERGWNGWGESTGAMIIDDVDRQVRRLFYSHTILLYGITKYFCKFFGTSRFRKLGDWFGCVSSETGAARVRVERDPVESGRELC